jgi:hypothetical protein
MGERTMSEPTVGPGETVTVTKNGQPGFGSDD